MAASPAPITIRSQRLNARRLRGLALTMFGMCLLFRGSATSAFATEDIPFEELDADQCFMFSLLVSHNTEVNHTVKLPLELVIDSEQDYRKLFAPEIMKQSCAGLDLSNVIINVDFSKQTVLGLWSTGTCADTGFRRRVLRDDIQKLITYVVVTLVGPKPACMGPGPESLNLIAIPKPPVGYKVVFENNHQ
jgi:hypothetical protein